MIRSTLLAGLSLLAMTGASALAADPDRAEVAALVRQTMEDQRRPLLPKPPRFEIRAADDDSRLSFDGFIQFQYVANLRDDDAGADDFEGGFRNRRLRISALGDLFDEQIGFKVTASFPRDDRPADLSDGYFDVRAVEGVPIRVGQFKLPLLREELTSAKRLLIVDRSGVNAVFTLERGQGFRLRFGGDPSRLFVAFSDGGDSGNTGFDDAPADWALTARFEHALAGSADVFSEATGPPGGSLHVALGLAGHIEESPSIQGVGGETLSRWTADLSAKGDGWSAQVAGVGQHEESVPVGGGDAVDWGFVAQAGLYTGESTEIFARFDSVLPDSDRAGDEAFSTITAGLNWYIYGHALKFSCDAQWFLDDAEDNDLIGGLSSRGFLGTGGEAGQLVLRAQMQVLF